MKAAVYHGIKDLRVEDVPEPEAGEDGVVVEVTACGICGSDLHSYLEGAFVEAGQVMGHEFAGTVVAVGSDVTGVQVGDRVTGVPIVPCGQCNRCKEGKLNLCDITWTTAIAYGKPGAFAQQVRIPVAEVGKNVFVLPDEVDDEAGATIEPLAVAVHAVKRVPSVEGATALVIGLGTIGVQTVQALKAYGARRVIGVDISPLRIDVARKLGADAYDSSAGLAETLAGALGEGEEVDLVFECSGVPPLAAAGIEAVRAGGTVVVLALYDDPVSFNPTGLVVQREVTITGSIAYMAEDFADAIELLRTGKADAQSLITHRQPLSDIAGAFETQLDKEHSIKVFVEPNA